MQLPIQIVIPTNETIKKGQVYSQNCTIMTLQYMCDTSQTNSINECYFKPGIQAYAWFLEIDLVCAVCMCVCMCPLLRL